MPGVVTLPQQIAQRREHQIGHPDQQKSDRNHPGGAIAAPGRLAGRLTRHTRSPAGSTPCDLAPARPLPTPTFAEPMAPATRSRAAAGGARAVMAITFRTIALCRSALRQSEYAHHGAKLARARVRHLLRWRSSQIENISRKLSVVDRCDMNQCHFAFLGMRPTIITAYFTRVSCRACPSRSTKTNTVHGSFLA